MSQIFLKEGTALWWSIVAYPNLSPHRNHIYIMTLY